MAEVKITDEIEKECLDAFFCPITREIMVNPVTLISDGHTYEMSAILQWFETGRRISPLTGKRVVSTNTTPNHALKKAIAEFLTKYPEHEKQIMDQKTLLKIIEIREKELLIAINKTNKDSNIESKIQSSDLDKMDKDVIELLTKLNQTKYISAFISNEIYSMNTMQLLTENDLKEIIDKVGPRRIIYNALQGLKNNKQLQVKKVDKNENKNDGYEVKKEVMSSGDDNDNNDTESSCTVCGNIGNKNKFFVIEDRLCCDDCYKWCSKHNKRCLKNSGEISFGTDSWYCYKCMIQCRCGVWWRPDEMNTSYKGSGVIVKCLVCERDVKM